MRALIVTLLFLSCTTLFPAYAWSAAGTGNIRPGAIVNINRAEPESISRYLKGIGPVKARAIVRHREQYGPFRTIEELGDVKGIGVKTVERLRPFIRLE